MALLIAALASSTWYECTAADDSASYDLKIGLMTFRLSASEDSDSASVSYSVCDAYITDADSTFCTAGRAALALGIVGILLSTIGVVFSLLLITSAAKPSFWGASLGTHIGAGVLTIVGGIGYIAALSSDHNVDNARVCHVKAGPILLIIGSKHSNQQQALAMNPGALLTACACTRLPLCSVCIGGVLSIFASCLHCTCCCPAARNSVDPPVVIAMGVPAQQHVIMTNMA